MNSSIHKYTPGNFVEMLDAGLQDEIGQSNETPGKLSQPGFTNGPGVIEAMPRCGK